MNFQPERHANIIRIYIVNSILFCVNSENSLKIRHATIVAHSWNALDTQMYTNNVYVYGNAHAQIPNWIRQKLSRTYARNTTAHSDIESKIVKVHTTAIALVHLSCTVLYYNLCAHCEISRELTNELCECVCQCMWWFNVPLYSTDPFVIFWARHAKANTS